MAEVLYVSKPVVPPWNDSSKNLVRDLATHLTRHTPRVLGRREEATWEPPRGLVEPLYPARAGGFAPGLRDNARVLMRLFTGPRADLWHFFFAPNPKSSRAGRAASRMRRVPTVQTVCSAPVHGANVVDLLFADRTVVLSRHTEARLRQAGVPEERLCRIPPAVPLLEPPTDEVRAATRRELQLPGLDTPLVVYPGDLEFGGGAELTLGAMAAPHLAGVHLAMACRAKTPRAQQAEQLLHERARELGLADRVTWVGETPRIHALLGAADVVSLPSEDLYAKMDYPLALLEAMSMRRPVVVGRATPAEELAEGDAAVAVPADLDALAMELGALVGDPERRARVGEAARAAVEQKYAPGPMAEAYEQVYDELTRDR